MSKWTKAGVVFGAMLVGGVAAPRTAGAQAVDAERVVPQAPRRPWFVSGGVGIAYNHFALETSGGARSYSGWGPAFNFQGGLRFRYFTLHATLAASMGLDPGMVGFDPANGPWPVSNLSHVHLGLGANVFVPSTPLYVGASFGVGALLMNFEKVWSRTRMEEFSPSTRANGGFAGSAQVGATFRAFDSLDLLVEVSGILGSYSAEATAPADLAARGQSGTWLALSTTLNVGARY